MFRNRFVITMLAGTLTLGALGFGGYRGITSAFAWIQAEQTAFDRLSRPILVDLAEQGWTARALETYAGEANAVRLAQGPLAEAFDKLRALGKVTKISAMSGFKENVTPASGMAVVVREVTFEKGKARIELDFVWKDDRWQLDDLRIAQ